MLRLEASTDVEPIELRLLLATSTALVVDRWRTLPFGADGVLDHPEHGRRAGLAVVAGAHPRPGTRYRLVTLLPVDQDQLRDPGGDALLDGFVEGLPRERPERLTSAKPSGPTPGR